MEKSQPAAPTETHLVQQIIACEWRQHRSWALETALFDDEMTRLQPKLEKEYVRIDEHTRAAHAWKSLADTSNSLRLLARYEASLHRRYLRAIKTLTELQNARKAAAPAEPAPAAPEPTEPTKTQNNETNPSPNPIDAPAMTESATPANPPRPFS